ncbi:type II toxin-antitoxin system Phd/YefM family antitoxin [Candidatus Saccharibacteria bacterium]|nr:type II toxin-antitoxin system Phd/YefM family antitoxin [Candidatus Saccharibacteria bacterium]
MGTKTIGASKLRSNLAAALNSLGGNDVLIVTRRGKKERAIVDIDKYEDLLAASDPQYLASIKKAREEYKKGEVVNFNDAFGNL